MKSVALIGMIEPGYKGDATERWGVNSVWKFQPGLDRLYYFDDPELFPPGFIDGLKEKGVERIITRDADDRLPSSEPYPLQIILDRFGTQYFTCTVAYMMAQAIYEGFQTIELHGMYHLYDSLEYVQHKPCIDYWCGVANGSGVKVATSDGTMIGQPMPWQSSLYGYVYNRNETLQIQTVAAAYRAAVQIMHAAHKACAAYPASFRSESKEKKSEQEIRTRRRLAQAMVDYP